MAKAARKQTGRKAGAARPAKRGGKKKTARKAPAKKKQKKKQTKRASRKKAAPKPARKKARAKGGARKAAGRRLASAAERRPPVDAPPPAFLPLLRPTAPLAELIGDEPRTRTRLLRELWIHIKRSGMQSTRDRTFFVPVRGVEKLFPEKREYSKLEVAAGLEGHLTPEG